MDYIFEEKFKNVPIYHMIITEDILVCLLRLAAACFV